VVHHGDVPSAALSCGATHARCQGRIDAPAARYSAILPIAVHGWSWLWWRGAGGGVKESIYGLGGHGAGGGV
jgi:hypothetical protein